ncbi:RagB/SusD family nutrient uptake outer membrane protein [Pedobacter antarcticus]|uniref:RagB/SusD family nutrient uptake outer membrane protein n=1 Tax=Pedobacter antarcticus TaxID=34086 RepID=UPI0029312114|nr:RagB/SusD family nutrient uptake outer membrane protein [Pedobacter antarcticus]
MKIAIFLLCITVTACLTSCKKFLDEKSNKKMVVISELRDLQALLDDAATMNNGTTPGYMESSADDYFLPPSVYNAQPSGFKTVYSWGRFPYFYSNDWNKSYLAVYNSNVCLEFLERINKSSSNNFLWDNVKGSALFYRSYYYLLLAWQYGKAYDQTTSNTDLGIVLRSGSDFNVPSVRATIEQTYQQILIDTKTSAGLLPSTPEHVLRPSKAAAYGLLSRIYLSMRMTDSAYKYADLCLQIKDELMDYNGDEYINGNISAQLPFKIYNKETIFYTEMFQSFSLHATNKAKIDSFLVDSYDVNDLRRTGFFQASNPHYQFKGNYTGNASSLFTGIATDEILLTRAECLARMNRVDEAMSDLNKLLKTRWNKNVPYRPITAEDSKRALVLILQERRKELLMRGLRWIDIKRLNKEGYNITPTRLVEGKTVMLKPNDAFYALPLPDDIIEQAGLQQN